MVYWFTAQRMGDRERAHMTVMAYYTCKTCLCAGSDPSTEDVRCWQCGGEVSIICRLDPNREPDAPGFAARMQLNWAERNM